jgi:transcription elongation factor Elf1
MKKCLHCNKNRLYLSPLATTQGNYESICPVCALVIVNKVHNLPEGTPFADLASRQMYNKEIEFGSLRNMVSILIEKAKE